MKSLSGDSVARKIIAERQVIVGAAAATVWMGDRDWKHSVSHSGSENKDREAGLVAVADIFAGRLLLLSLLLTIPVVIQRCS
jgi:hypothetical protein